MNIRSNPQIQILPVLQLAPSQGAAAMHKAMATPPRVSIRDHPRCGLSVTLLQQLSSPSHPQSLGSVLLGINAMLRTSSCLSTLVTGSF